MSYKDHVDNDKDYVQTKQYFLQPAAQGLVKWNVWVIIKWKYMFEDIGSDYNQLVLCPLGWQRILGSIVQDYVGS